MNAASARAREVVSSLSFRLVFILSLTILLLLAAHTTLTQRSGSAAIESVVKTSAFRAGDFIKRSLYTAMLRNERDRIHEMIVLLGNEPGIEVIRIYNKQGEITFSSAEREIGTSVDLQAEACFVCHAAARPLSAVPTGERARIYRGAGGHRVLGLINPIRNDAACTEAACHAHSPAISVLGVLDVQMSLETTDAAALAARRRAIAISAVVIAVSMALIAAIVYRSVYVPTLRLRRVTERLAGGDLTVEVDSSRSDELGRLARSFNRMARALAEADAELRDWSRTLEERVRQKTAQLELLNVQLIRAEKSAALGRMAATVAHELNNPLSGILTHARLASRRVARLVPDGEEQQRIIGALDLICSEAMRCGNIVRDLLTYSRQGSAEFRPAALHDLVDRALQVVAHHTELRGIAVERRLELADDRLMCDPEQIIQALIALFINSIEAMNEGGRLTVSTGADVAGDNRIQIRVSDTGVGIPPEVQAHIFDPFFSTKEETKGVGLGLAVVYGIVQRHEGRIDVESRPGHGTTFIIALPRELPGSKTAGAQTGAAGAEEDGHQADSDR